jgi:hypothetical protein
MPETDNNTPAPERLPRHSYGNTGGIEPSMRLAGRLKQMRSAALQITAMDRVERTHLK